MPSKKSKKKLSSGLKRYNEVQKALSSYGKEHNVKFGKDFRSKASELYNKTKSYPVKYVSQNIETLYNEYFFPKKIARNFQENIPFYSFVSVVNEPNYDNVKISVSFSDDKLNVSKSGSSHEIENWYNSTLHRHLRENYNSSPPAFFMLTDTDNSTYVDYAIETGEAIPGTVKPMPSEPVIPKKNIDLKIEKEKTKQIKELRELIKDLKSIGMSDEKIQEQINKFKEEGGLI